ncbi:MAG TPA: amidohydrolase family protein [Xanthobacteraceae bacterium]|jgi:N-acyl-D-aspartate/D-glutamate deacylase|nr:amidohydrolase family protein [Xanthobacteraceae bacterium]
MHDIVIRGGTIIDGTGRPPFTGDLAIEGERIVAVGGRQGPARRDIDAAGLLVTPGWVDAHTHYDGQAMWDPLLAPSCWHGVTTAIFGNCGVGFAPVRPQHRAALMELMEGVEEIPGVVLADGLSWDWETFPEFLDALERRPRAIDIAAQLAHHPLRVYVMGDRAIRLEAATADDIAEMRRLTIEALRAGAFGFTTSRTDSHKTPVGEMVPSRYAGAEELLGIGSALGAVGAGAFGMNSDFDDEAAELAWITQLARETGRPVWFLLTDRYEDPQRWRRLLTATHAARAEGAQVTAQIAGRPIGVMMGIGTALNPFSLRPSYREVDGLGIAEQRRRLAHPDLRRRILAEKPSDEEVSRLAQFRQLITTRWDRFFVMTDPPDYEPASEMSVAAIAAGEGRTPDEVAYDYLTEAEKRFLFFPIVNYVQGDHEPIREMLTDPATLLGLSDGGAHCASIVDAGVPTFMLVHWGRDRRRGPRLPLEMLVKRQTSETADFFGLSDRGRLAPGLRADVNLIDFDGLRLYQPELVNDLPAGGRRFVQRVDGYRATLVAGTPIFEDGEHTGALPGRLVRAGSA